MRSPESKAGEGLQVAENKYFCLIRLSTLPCFALPGTRLTQIFHFNVPTAIGGTAPALIGIGLSLSSFSPDPTLSFSTGLLL